MFTDIVGYTALGQRDESLSLAVVDAQQKLVRPVIARHEGREVKTIGDAFLVEFSSAIEAVRCAYDVQRSVREFNLALESGKRLHIRVGIHLGEVVEKDGDILGDAVNVASRVQPFAEDGGVCLTQQVYDQVHNKLELPLASIGLKSLKNVNAPLEIYKMVMPWADGKTTSSTELDKKRIAVLPLLNMSADPEDQYFADGMTEELISTLSRLKGLTVIARTSVMRYKGTSLPIGEICRELKAGSALEGSVRKSENRVRITEQLIDARTDGSLWSQTYDRDLKDVFAIQSEIAQQVADSLTVRLLTTEKESLETWPTQSTGAHTLYLKGRFYWNERTRDANGKAVKYFEEATRLDPKFSLAYAGLADCWIVYADYGWRVPREAFLRAKEYALKSIEIDPTLAEPHAVLGVYFGSYEYEWGRSDEEFARAIRLNPSYATTYQWHALILRNRLRFEESYAEITKALELDPLSRAIGVVLGEILMALGRLEEATEQLRLVAASYPDSPFVHRDLCWVYYLGSRTVEAFEEIRKSITLSGGEPIYESDMAALLGLTGRTNEANKLIGELEDRAKSTYVDKARLAVAMFCAGRADEAFSLLEKSDWVQDLNWEPWLKELRKDSRWISVRQGVRLPGS
jgi:adenylate cyclase